MTHDDETARVGLRLRWATAHGVWTHCQREAPNEACGLIVGHDGDGQTRVLPLRNNTTRDRQHAWLVHEQDYLRALLALERTGERLIAVYHSHPVGPSTLSPQDEVNLLTQRDVRHHVLADLTQCMLSGLSSWCLDPTTGAITQEVLAVSRGS